MDKEKGLKKLFIIMDFILIFCCLLFWKINSSISKQNVTHNIYYFNGTNTWQSPNLYIVSNICLLILPIILFLQIKKNAKKSSIIIIVSVSIIIIVGLSILNSAESRKLWDQSKTYYYFESPINGIEVIAEEWSWLQGGGVNFYERINEKQIRRIGNILTDDGYRVLEDSNYSLKWSESELTISYSFRGNGQDEVWKTEHLYLAR